MKWTIDVDVTGSGPMIDRPETDLLLALPGIHCGQPGPCGLGGCGHPTRVSPSSGAPLSCREYRWCHLPIVTVVAGSVAAAELACQARALDESAPTLMAVEVGGDLPAAGQRPVSGPVRLRPLPCPQPQIPVRVATASLVCHSTGLPSRQLRIKNLYFSHRPATNPVRPPQGVAGICAAAHLAHQ